MKVFVVTSDARENGPQVLSVRLNRDDAYEDAKAYILASNNDPENSSVDEKVQKYKDLPAKKFYKKFGNAWVVGGDIIEIEVT